MNSRDLKVRARQVYAHALRTGLLVPRPCEQKSRKCKGRIEGHHVNYSEPLNVKWLCKYHHTLAHFPDPNDLQITVKVKPHVARGVRRHARLRGMTVAEWLRDCIMAGLIRESAAKGEAQNG